MKKLGRGHYEHLGLADIPQNSCFALNVQAEIGKGFDGFNQEFQD